MRQVAWILLGLAALLWSLFAWALHAIAGSGEAAVTTMTRWLQIDPTSTIWLADLLATIGGPTQILIIIGWLIGMAALGLTGWFASHVTDQARSIASEAARAARETPGVFVDGEVKAKTFAPPPPAKPFDG